MTSRRCLPRIRSPRGEPYRPAGPLVTRASKRSQREREQHFYVQLDARFWTEGWVTELSGAAIAMYLACLYEQRGRDGEIWVSPRMVAACVCKSTMRVEAKNSMPITWWAPMAP